MLIRLVSNSWSHDSPTLASQSAGIIGMSHCAWPLFSYIWVHHNLAFFVFCFGDEVSVCPPGWRARCNLDWPKPLPTRLEWFFCFSLQSRHPPPCLANFFVFLVETGFHHVGQACFELLTSGDLPTLASQGARITGVSHCAWPSFLFSM